MKQIYSLSLLILVVAGCKKDSLGTKPQITFKSYSSSPIYSSAGADVTFEVKDGDGDIENSLNIAAIFDAQQIPEPDTPWTAKPMPNLGAHNGSKLTAEVIVHMQSIDFPQDPDRPVAKDSVHYLVYVLDNAGNSSDTIVTPKVEVLYQ